MIEEPLNPIEILDMMSYLIKETITICSYGKMMVEINLDRESRRCSINIVGAYHVGNILMMIRDSKNFICSVSSSIGSNILFSAKIDYDNRTISINEESRHSYLTDGDIDGWFNKLADKFNIKIIWQDNKKKLNNTQKINNAKKGFDVKMKKPKHTAIMEEYGIEDILFNLPKKVTTVVFTDGTISVVKCHKNEKFSCEIGLCQAITRHILGGKRSNVTKLVKKGVERSARRNRIIENKLKRKEDKNE